MKFKIFFLSFLFSLPFWWSMNSLGNGLENMWFNFALAKDPKVLLASAQDLYAPVASDDAGNIKPSIEAVNLEIMANAAISVEIDKDGRQKVFFEKNSSDMLPIASITKLMTAYAAFETYASDFSRVITIGNEAASLEWASKTDNYKAGETLTAENLLYSMLIESSNHAAYAITEPIGQAGFAEMMNLYAKEIGLQSTNFVNSTGLEPNDESGALNTSSAGDLVKLAEKIYQKYPKIFEITANKSFEIKNADGSIHHIISENTDKLLGKFEEIIGGKTGQSPVAKGCLLILLKNPDKPGNYFINIILGSDDRFGDMEKLIILVNGISRR